MSPLQIIESPTERTTAFTDLLMAVLSGLILIVIQMIETEYAYKVAIWSWVLGLMGLAALLGAIAHGFKMSESVNRRIWLLLNLALGLVVALFALAVMYDIWGQALSRQATLYLLILGLLFWLVTIIRPGSFLIFVIYELLFMLFALIAYTYLGITGGLAGAGWMALSILLMIIAAGIQASGKVSLRFIWPFDHNGVFHLVQMLGALVLFLGLTIGLRS